MLAHLVRSGTSTLTGGTLKGELRLLNAYPLQDNMLKISPK